jgi:uncharacterized protein (TIGR00255 family)
VRAILKDLTAQALKDFLLRKKEEGQALAQDMLKRLELIENESVQIEGMREDPLTKYRQKLELFLKELGQLQLEGDDRILKEIALLAEKSDVTEELVRLRAHIAQFKSHLQSGEKAIGKTLEFVVQEMHREINTLGSKSTDSNISRSVIKMKSELEKIREQVQNIE